MSAAETDSHTRAQVWFKPAQVQAMRAAAQSDTFQPYLRDRNETLLALLYDTGLRVGEVVQVDVEMLRLDDDALYVPTQIQKDYPTERTPPSRTMELGEDGAVRDTVTRLRSYLTTRWRDSPALLPSRQTERMSTESVRSVVTDVAREAGVEPFLLDGSRGRPEAVTPHTLRASVAYRMLRVEDGYTLYDVRNRLRHATIQTTERTYDHFDRV